MKAPSPAFSFYPKDVESDETCKAMTHAEFGMYIRLLMNCWTEGSIPADPIRLQRILKISHKTFKASWPAIEPCFKRDGDRFRQLRLEKEREKQAERSRAASESGRIGATVKKSIGSHKQSLDSSKNDASADYKLDTSYSSSSSSSSSSPESTDTNEDMDEVREQHAIEETRLTKNILYFRNRGDDIQAVMDLVAEKDRKPYSVYYWERSGGRSGVPVSRKGVTVLRLLNAALEARQRAHGKPYLSENSRKSMEAINRVTGMIKNDSRTDPDWARALEGSLSEPEV